MDGANCGKISHVSTEGLPKGEFRCTAKPALRSLPAFKIRDLAARDSFSSRCPIVEAFPTGYFRREFSRERMVDFVIGE